MIGRVYDIGDFKIKVEPDKGGFTYAGDKQCHHRNLVFDENGQTVECEDCKKTVTAWWAFMSLCRQHERVRQTLLNAQEVLHQEQQRNLTHKAAIAVEDAWRRRKMIPVCPHCSKPIMPADGFGKSAVGKHYAADAKPLEFRGDLQVVAGYRAPEDEKGA